MQRTVGLHHFTQITIDPKADYRMALKGFDMDGAGALARRPPMMAVTSLTAGDLEMDLLTRTVIRAGKRIELLAQEFKILEYLLRHTGEVVTRTMLLEKVWDFHFDPKTNIVETHISRLRSKIDKGFNKPLLHTVRGAGYVIRPPD